MIRHLPEDVRASIRTGFALTSFAQTVEELVLNGIDAGASSIAVRVDLSCFKVQVVDNGAGISLDQFLLIGERYSTSKCNKIEDLENLKYFGYRGEALASIRTAASFLEVISRSKTSALTYSKCFQNGNALDITQASQSRPSAGTTVTAHDLFYNLPVRRKRLNGALEMEKIRYRIAGIALMWPQISFSLRDDSIGHVILQTHKCSGIAASFSYIFTPTRARGLMEVSAERDEFILTGVVSKESYSRMDLQFVFVNKRLVLKSSIHRQINKILGRSLILRRKGLSNEVIENNLKAGGSNVSSPQKQQDRYAIFAVNVECPYSCYDITFDPSKTLVEFRDWPKLIHLLQDMIYGFLRNENLLSMAEPASSTALDYVSDADNEDDDNDDNDDDYSYKKTVHFENETLSQKQSKNDNSSQIKNNVGRPMSAVIENVLFSKLVHRPKGISSKSAFVSSEQTKSMSGDNQEHVTETAFLNDKEQIVKSKLQAVDSPTGSCSKKKSVQPPTHVTDVPPFKQNTETKYKKLDQDVNRNLKNENIRKSSFPCSLISEDDIVCSESLTLPSGQNMNEDTEEIFVKGQTIPERKEITLGNSIHYSSTLRSLRETRQLPSSSSSSASATKCATEIITNTLQQLRQSNKMAVKNLGNVYKTPERLNIVDLDTPPPIKQPKLDESVYENRELTARVPVLTESVSACTTSKLTRKASHNAVEDNLQDQSLYQLEVENVRKLDNSSTFQEEPSFSAVIQSTEEETLFNKNGQKNGLKRNIDDKKSHASKLARLMRGENIVENLQDINSKKVDDNGCSSSKHSALLNTFSYSRSIGNPQQKHKNIEVLTAETNKLSKVSSQTASLTNKDLPLLSTTIAHDLPSSRKERNTDLAKEMEKTNKVTSSETQTCCFTTETSACCTWCHTRKQLAQTEGNLPFSIYKSNDDMEHHTEYQVCKSPKISVVLSLPMENVMSKNSQPDIWNKSEAVRSNVSNESSTQNKSLKKVEEQNFIASKAEHVIRVASSSTQTRDILPGHLYRQKATEKMKEMPCLVSNPFLCETDKEIGTGKGDETLTMSQGFNVASIQICNANTGASVEAANSSLMVESTNSIRSAADSGSGFESVGFCPTNYLVLSTEDELSIRAQSASVENILTPCPESVIRDMFPGVDASSVKLIETYNNASCSKESNQEVSSADVICVGSELSVESDSDFPIRNNMNRVESPLGALSSLSSSSELIQADSPSDVMTILATGNPESLVNECDSAYQKESIVSTDAVILAYDSLKDCNEINTVPETEDTEKYNIEENNNLNILELDCDKLRANNDNKCAVNNSDENVEENNLTEIKDMIASAKHMFENMKKSLGLKESSSDLFDDSSNKERNTSSLLNDELVTDHIQSKEKNSEVLVATETQIPIELTGKATLRTSTYYKVDSGLTKLRPSEVGILPDSLNVKTNDVLPCGQRVGSNKTCFNSCSLDNDFYNSDERSGLTVLSNDYIPLSQFGQMEMLPSLSKSHNSYTLLKEFSGEPGGQDLTDVDGQSFSQSKNMPSDVEQSNKSTRNSSYFLKRKAESFNTKKQICELDNEATLQEHLQTEASSSKHSSSETDLSNVMSAEGDQVLMMVDEPVLSPIKLANNSQSSETKDNFNYQENQSTQKLLAANRQTNLCRYQSKTDNNNTNNNILAVQDDAGESINYQLIKTKLVLNIELDPANEGLNSLQLAKSSTQKAESESTKNVQTFKSQSVSGKKTAESQKVAGVTPCWKAITNAETGQQTFVNNQSGHTVSEEQWQQMSIEQQKEMLTVPSEIKSSTVIPEPVVFSSSQKQAFKEFVNDHFEKEENEAMSKWRDGQKPVYDRSIEVDITTLMADWKNPVFLNYKQPGLLADVCPSGAVARSCFNSLSSVEFNKSMLKTLKVIGQLDNKFIACIIEMSVDASKAVSQRSSSLLVLFDQHAIHERIRLEHLITDVYEVENGERTDRIKRSEVKPAQSIILDQDDLRLMKAFSQEFNRIGVTFTADKTSRELVHINCFPSCLVDKDTNEIKKNKITNVVENVEILIKEHIELLKSTNGACGRLPLTIHKVLCSKACHGAVKFGDRLTLQECQDLVSSLASCSLPFQCAHGRPSVAPLVNLRNLEKELLTVKRPPNLRKISETLNK